MVDTAHTYVIVGAGPAGLQLSYHLQQQGADYLTLERSAEPGGFFRRFPRHRRLISTNTVHTASADPQTRLRWDGNSLLNDSPDLLFPNFSREYLPAADDLVRYLAEFQRVHQLRVRYGTTVERITREDDGFSVRTDRGGVRARCLVVATGWGRPFVPDIPGIEHATGYEEMDVDPDRYAGRRVLIIGKGNAAFETASALLGSASTVHLASRRPVRLAWHTGHPGDVRGQYGAILDSHRSTAPHAVLDCTVDRIRPVDGGFRVRVTHPGGGTAELDYHEVLRCTGFRMDTTAFDAGCRPELAHDGRIPALRPDWQSSNIDDLYFAGTVAQARDVRHASSPFIDGFRYNLRTLTRILRERYDDVPIPVATTPGEPASLAKVLLDRVNGSSALWTQFEYLGDVLVRDGATGDFRHYEDLPEDYALARFADAAHCYTLTLRWGRDDHGDAPAVDRPPTPGRVNAALHPVLRRYRHGELLAEQHLPEDLSAEWRRPDRHVQPLVEFLMGDLNGGS
ncbi:NAD(P)-binding domain-containing protein [Micromonospora rifamycinica]|uniref:NAD(P)-binding domain-containing protein n=1 Tax=Micromonospora rifamycinica TaxID=291594 RepID=UPI0033C157E2